MYQTHQPNEDVREKLLNFILKDILNAPLEEDVLRHDGTNFFVGGLQLPITDHQAILLQAESMKEMLLWKLLIKDVKYIGQRKIGAESTNWESVFFGKAMLYIADLIEKKVANLNAILMMEKKKNVKKINENQS